MPAWSVPRSLADLVACFQGVVPHLLRRPDLPDLHRAGGRVPRPAGLRTVTGMLTGAWLAAH